MLKKSIPCGVLALCLTISTTVYAEENHTSKIKNEFDGIAETTPPKKINWLERSSFGNKGNVTVYVDKNGTPTEVYVVGVAPVSTTLVAVEAEEEAQEDAEFKAKAAFALWMSEHFTVKNTRDKKILVVRKNGEESESVSISKRKATQMASSAWRGMSVFWHKRSKGRYIVVWRWSATEQKLAKLVEMLTRDGNTSRQADQDVKDVEGFR